MIQIIVNPAHVTNIEGRMLSSLHQTAIDGKHDIAAAQLYDSTRIKAV